VDRYNKRGNIVVLSSVIASLAIAVILGQPFYSKFDSGKELTVLRPSHFEGLVLGVSSDGKNVSEVKFDSGVPVSFDPSPKDQRVLRLREYLVRHHSPLANYAELIVTESDKYRIPYKLVVAIAYHESGLCRKCFKPYNCWGWMTKDNWESFEEAIPKYIRGLYKGYFSRGADTIEEIAPNYVMTDKWPDFVVEIERLMAEIP